MYIVGDFFIYFFNIVGVCELLQPGKPSEYGYRMVVSGWVPHNQHIPGYTGQGAEEVILYIVHCSLFILFFHTQSNTVNI
jgi:hypothetical protein